MISNEKIFNFLIFKDQESFVEELYWKIIEIIEFLRFIFEKS